jgi:iron(III) transport system permease protein
MVSVALGRRVRGLSLSVTDLLALALCLAALCLPVFLPYGALINAAFSPIATTLVTPLNATMHNIYFTFFELSSTKVALKNTFILGALSATLGTLLALMISYLTAREAVRGHRVLAFLATAPIAIPGIVLGVGLFLAYTRGPIVLYGTLWILLLAYLTIELPAAYQQLHSAFKSLSPELEEASRILGASRLRMLRDVTAPLLGPSLIATWCFIFVAVVRELSAAVILFTSETKVLSVLIFDLKESGDLAAIAVLGLTMLVLTSIVIIAANRIPGFSGGVRLRNN